ncbi:MAG: right-handed parallel beta-helix repeat-containing protein [Chloroflexi bacterium]|nr:right-handed parallel beta-helix repeat-containing protein [Chloroflexota bacterium]
MSPRPARRSELTTAIRAAQVDWRGVRLLVALMLTLVMLAAPFVGRGADTRRPVVRDTFSRAIAQGWASPETGGRYRYPGGTDGLSVAGGQGVARLAAGTSRVVAMPQVDLRDLDLRFRFSLDRLPTGKPVFITAALRRTGGQEYRARVRVARDGSLRVAVLRVRGRVLQPIGSEVAVQGVRVTSGRTFWLRTRVRGTQPTAIDVRIWRDGRPQPARWTVRRMDRRSAITRGGSVAIRLGRATEPGAKALSVRIDDVRVRRAVALAVTPTAEATPKPTPKPTSRPKATTAPTPKPTKEPKPEATPEPTEEATPKPTKEPTPEATEEATPKPTKEPTPDGTPKPTKEPTPSPEPTEEATPKPTKEPTPSTTPTPTPEPTVEPTPSATPSSTPSPSPSPTPTPDPTPTVTPSTTPTPGPSATPSPDPTPSPSPAPTSSPSPSPTPTPTPSPSPTPTPSPSADPSGSLYVSTDGDDKNPGTSTLPFRTIQKAANVVQAGGTILVRPGRYVGFTISRSGTSAEPIVIRAASGRPIIDGALGAGRLDVVKVNGAHDIRIQGFEIRGAQGGDYSGAGIRTENGASRIVIADNVIVENHSYGINSHSSTDITIRDNDIHHNETGVHINRGGAGTRILDNDIHHNVYMVRNTPKSVNGHDDTGAIGIAFVRSTGPTLASGNRIWGNRAASYDYEWDGSAFEIYGASNVTITDNVAWDNENVLETGTDKTGPACADNVFARNVAYGATSQGRSWGMFLRCSTDMLVAHNTFHDLDGFAFAIGTDSANFSGSLDGLTIVNNIISFEGSGAKVFGLVTALPSSVTIDRNLTRTTGTYATLADGRKTSDPATFATWTGFQTHGISGDPRFRDAAGRDYRLRAASPAIDAGKRVPGVSDSWAGAAPDLGRYERAQ